MSEDLVQIQAPGGPRFYVRPTPGGSDSLVVNEIFGENVYRIAPGDCHGIVVDIGANIGVFSVYAALHGAEMVHAIEPEPENFALLKRNTRPYSVIRPHALAIWDADATVRLSPSQGATKVLPAGPVSAPALRLSTFLVRSGCGRIAMMKIDTEGAECRIIADTPSVLLDQIDYIALEFHPASTLDFGLLVARLSLTHQMQMHGSHDRGGYIYARRY